MSWVFGNNMPKASRTPKNSSRSANSRNIFFQLENAFHQAQPSSAYAVLSRTSYHVLMKSTNLNRSIGKMFLHKNVQQIRRRCISECFHSIVNCMKVQYDLQACARLHPVRLQNNRLKNGANPKPPTPAQTSRGQTY